MHSTQSTSSCKTTYQNKSTFVSMNEDRENAFPVEDDKENMHITQSIISYKTPSQSKSTFVNTNEDRENAYPIKDDFLLLSPKDIVMSEGASPGLRKRAKLCPRPLRSISNDYFEASCGYQSTKQHKSKGKEYTSSACFLSSPNKTWGNSDSVNKEETGVFLLPRGLSSESPKESSALFNNNLHFNDQGDTAGFCDLTTNSDECKSLVCLTPKRNPSPPSTSPPLLNVLKCKNTVAIVL